MKKALGFSAFFIACRLLLFTSFTSAATINHCSLTSNEKTDETVYVRHVHDGDTVKLSDGRKIRIIGINTPELGSSDKNTKAEPFARQARDFLRKLIKNSKSIQIRYGVQKKDHYGRLLAHIFINDGRNISAVMLKNGLARSLYVPPNDWQFRCYDQLDQRAQKLKIGLWSNPYYKTVDVSTLTPRNNYQSQFIQVSGMVTRVGDSKNNLWINLGSEFAIRINKSSLAAFKKLDLNLILNKKITARGYVVYHPNKKQFRMLIRHPIALTITSPSK
jgi:endonuclease YncB( thermonuclease family)